MEGKEQNKAIESGDSSLSLSCGVTHSRSLGIPEARWPQPEGEATMIPAACGCGEAPVRS